MAGGLLAGCGRPAPKLTAAPACPAGVVAQTRATDLAFSSGWTRLALAACPGAPEGARALEVDGADRLLAYAPGRPGGATAAILTAGPPPAPGERQVFATPAGSARAREVVLAPWPYPSPAPRLRRIRLVATGRS